MVVCGGGCQGLEGEESGESGVTGGEEGVELGDMDVTAGFEGLEAEVEGLSTS